MTGLLVLATSIAVAFFLGRGLEPWRPTDSKRLVFAMAAAIASSLVVELIVWQVRAAGGQTATFLGFASGVVLLGYMVLAGAWALRFLADQVARYR